jgi:antitoxin component YwqK of YwqJK toxin-antitoxin module
MAGTSDTRDETVRYKNGNVKYTGHYLDDEFHGSWTWYRTDGTVMRSGQFDRGRRVGVWRTYDRSGAVVKDTDFSGG